MGPCGILSLMFCISTNYLCTCIESNELLLFDCCLELGGAEHSSDHWAPGVAGDEGADRLTGWPGCRRHPAELMSFRR